ncbi:MAG: preprotein translocase subunit YajC [Candidatus Edwardsbacteria bacterium]
MFNVVYAMGSGGGGQSSQGGWVSIAPLILMFVVIYILLIFPQQRRQKKHQQMLSALQKGDRILAAGGIYGTVIGIDEARGIIVLRIAENVKIEVQRNSVIAKIEEHSKEK